MEISDVPDLTQEDHEKFLQKLQERNTRLGSDAPKVEVRFEDLSVEAEVDVGRRVLPTLVNTTIDVAQELMGLLKLYPTKKKPVKILHGLTGLIKPKRMTLILGSPGSGKSTFLKALSGKLDSKLKVTGRVTYNGQIMNRYISPRMCTYIGQYDLHHAEMTARETLEFSKEMMSAEDAFESSEKVPKRDMESSTNEDRETNAVAKEPSSAKEEEEDFLISYILKMLGLNECADTIIGDEMRRGISGGQKKRVTIGEMLVGLARSFFMDDISTGLDSSTTFEIVKFLRQLTHFMELTMVISLLQPPLETYELFDDIILLCEGQIAYQGPRENVLEFFETMGFKCPERKNTADFLQEVTSEMDQAQYWVGNQNKYQYIPIQKFADSFNSFRVSRLPANEFHQTHGQTENDQMLRLEERYKISKWKLFKACFSREMLLMKRNSPVHIFIAIQIGLLAVVTMTVFFRTEMNHHSIADGNRYMGAVFSGVVIVMFNGMTELTIMIRRLPIFYKQRAQLYLPGWALLSSITVLSLPISFLETGLWTCLTYYVIGFAPSAIRFFQQFLAFFCVHQMSLGLFRFIAVIGRTQIMANTLGTATLIAVYILGGFVISKDDIQPWLIWGYWLSPMTYAQNAVAINEFLDKRWSRKADNGPNNTYTIGKAILQSRGMLSEWHWFWYCVGVLLGFVLLFNILSIFALEYLKAPYKSHAITSVGAKDVKKTAKNDKQGDEKTCHYGQALPFQPLTLAFSHISYYVDMPKNLKKHGVREKRLQLLRDVSGAFRPGVLTVLMGVTGAGKTTLLDVLAGRKTAGHIEGSISISGYPKRQKTFARISGYCEQTDNHSPFLTVYESLQYSARLRLPSHIDAHTRTIFVNEVMDLVELRPFNNAMVGLPGTNRLAAEQRKRLTIAVELVSSPSIIFMDEPTTGLDARSAAIIMRTVRKTVDTGRTIVCTIHQPSIDIFEAFDELLLMKKGGQLIYGGPLGPLSRNMIRYFEAIPGVPKIRDGQNPAAWMLDVTSPAMEYKLRIDFGTIFHNSSLYIENMQLVDELSKAQTNSRDLHFPSKYAKSFISQCIACMWKQHRSYWKNPEHNIVRFIITISTALLFGTVFLGTGSNITTEQDIFNILGAMYGSAMFVGFANGSILQPVVEIERTVFYRERAAGMFSSMPYAIAQVAIEIPYIIIQVFIFSLIVYPMMGFEFASAKLIWFMFFMLLSFMYFVLFGMMTVALTPNLEIASILSFFIFIMWSIFCGFFIPRTMIPIWWRWFYWANPAAWTVYGLTVSQLGDHVDYIHVAGGSDETVKKFLKEYLGLQDNHLPLIVTLHFGLIILFLFVFGVSIKYLNFQRR
ncbi:ABC transporter G family member 45-like [Phoenix dactylifera]|uniref:ABC transporter G family member 45-like n=1 Tax=Phoenix dactylifera TaxID=42345 RepID=A0A8B7BVS2_PHODC|nr:ABC transporter G family member 45-like [Phoenix dactylifera]